MRSIKYFLLALLLIFSAQAVNGQNRPVTQHYENRKFVFSFDSDRNFLNGDPVRFFGFKVGLQFDDKFRVGMGLQVLADFIPTLVTLNPGEENEFIADAKLDITLLTSYYERILYTSKRWEFSVPLHHGIGGVSRSYVDEEGNTQTESGGAFVLLSLAIEGHFKVFSWIGVGAGTGYRLAFYQDKHVQRLVNSPIYVVKMKLFIGDLYKAIFAKEKPWDKYRKNKKGR